MNSHERHALGAGRLTKALDRCRAIRAGTGTKLGTALGMRCGDMYADRTSFIGRGRAVGVGAIPDNRNRCVI